MVLTGHGVGEAVFLLPQNKAMGWIVGWLCVFDDRVLVHADLSRGDGGQVLARIFGEGVFRRSFLLDHERLNVDGEFEYFENRG